MTSVFNYANPRVIHWGAGSIARLESELAKLRSARVALMTTRSILANEQLLAQVRMGLGAASVPVTVVVGQHTPLSEVEAAVEQAAQGEIDGIVSFGGGSAIDAAKIVSLKIADRRGLLDHRLPHVAIPTTLSVAELAGGAGFTDAAGNKAGMRDPRLLPDSVIYDANLALATPISLWLSTGIRALDHAVEGFLADGLHPFSDVMALEAVRRLFSTLPQAKARPDDLSVRTENQLAAWFSFTLPAQSASGLSHVMGKQIGARHRIPHGVTSCLLLPHVMRYLATKKPERMAEIASATGVGTSALGAADDVERLVASLKLPQHIGEYGVGEPELRKAAEELESQYPAADLLAVYLAAL